MRKGMKAIGILMVCIALLTFFSKSFYNYRLPEVVVAFPEMGNLAFTTSGISEITFSKTDSIYAEVDGRITAILVNAGEFVKKGDCIMKFQTGQSPETVDIKSDVEGVVIAVGVKKGMYVSSMQNTVLYEIAPLPQKSMCSLFITEEQVQTLSVDADVMVTMKTNGEKLEGQIQEIVEYTSQNESGYQVHVALEMSDESKIGEKVDISIEKQSEEYDTIIPISAIHKDSDGYYVLTLREEDSVLGEGYAAEKMSVELLDSDGTYCAVRGVPADEAVIIAATSEVLDGTKVYYGGGTE